MSEKIAVSISKLIAKTNTFEKVESWLKAITLFMVIAGTASVYNSYTLYTLTKSINNTENKLNKIIETNEKIILLMENDEDMNEEDSSNENQNMNIEIDSIECDNIVCDENKNANENKIEDYYEFIINN
jgi:hypothetical protein